MSDTRRFSRHLWRPGDPRAVASGRKGRLASSWHKDPGVHSAKAHQLNAEFLRREAAGERPPNPHAEREKLIRQIIAKQREQAAPRKR